MRNRTLDLIGSLSGVFYFVAVLGGLTLAATPDLGAPQGDIVRSLSDADTTSFYAGSYVSFVGQLFFILLVSRLWGTLRSAEGDPGWVSGAALAGGTGGALLHLTATVFPITQLLRVDQGIDASVAVSLNDLSLSLHWLAEGVLTLFFAAAGLIILGTGVLSRWLGWSALVIAAGLIVTLPMVKSLTPMSQPLLAGSGWWHRASPSSSIPCRHPLPADMSCAPCIRRNSG